MQKKQAIIGIILLVVLLITIMILYHLSRHQHEDTSSPQQQETVTDGVLSNDFSQANQLSALEQQQVTIDKLTKALEKLRAQAKASKQDDTTRRTVLLKTINDIITKREAETKLQKSVSNQPSATAANNHQAKRLINNNQPKMVNYQQPATVEQFTTITFHYDEPVEQPTAEQNKITTPENNKKTPKTYVPAGTFARGVLLEGADANASVNGQSNTVGILVRLLDSGTLPNGGHSHLKGCFLLASLYGDISSERGEARLTRLSCLRPDGSIFEKSVQGYLSFAGKEGIKGRPVMRNGKILQMAGLSGLLSGFGSTLQQASQIQSTSALGVTSTVNSDKVWQNALAGGAGTALNRLAGYYIKRADQYHPVIEIGSGTVATVIFQRGFSLVDDDSEGQGSARQSSATSSRDDEAMKQMLAQANQLSANKQAAPFSNLTG